MTVSEQNTSLRIRFESLDNQEAFAEDYLAEVKEWLQQKQQKHKQTIMISIDELFEELLEEMKKNGNT